MPDTVSKNQFLPLFSGVVLLCLLCIFCAADSVTIVGQWERQVDTTPPMMAQVTLIQETTSGKQSLRYTLDGKELSPEEALAYGLPEAPPTSEAAEAATIFSQAKAALPKSPLSRPTWLPVTAEKGLSKNSPTITLTAPDMAIVREEDEQAKQSPDKGGIRIGILRDLPKPLTITGDTLPWNALPDGSAYTRVSLESPGALGMRIAFTAFSLPGSAECWLVNEENTQQGIRILTPLAGDSFPYWSPTCPGEKIDLFLRLRDTTEKSGIYLQATQLVHIYLNPLAEMAEKAAGTCNIDAMCDYAAWSDYIAAVGGLSTINQVGALFCTCTLIADNDPCTDSPLLLTANHCVNGQDTGTWPASTLEIYWYYQTDRCNTEGGTAPSILTVPRTTGGADYLVSMAGTGAMGGGSDVSLLRLRNDPPAGIPKMGWTTSLPATGADVTTVHHPKSGYKRISHGKIVNRPRLHPEWYHYVIWDSGTTESGSSGASLVRNDTHQIIGQLWGGDASCEDLYLQDDFGRFDKSYTILQPFLEMPMGMINKKSLQVSESTGSAIFSVTLTRKTTVGATLGYAVTGGTARLGVDYVKSSGIITFAAGENAASFSFPFLNDIDTDGSRTIILSLVQVNTCIKPYTQNNRCTITQTDDDPDSDGDGISDEAERTGAHGGIPTDPYNSDTDSDGLTDYQEIFGYRGYVTNPTYRDTDGDGHDDYLEIQFGLNPLDPSDRNALSSLSLPWFK